MIRICISGLGKTGIQVAKYLTQSKKAILVSGICRSGSSKEGKNVNDLIGCKGTTIPIFPSNKIEQCIFTTKPDVILDFSTPKAALQNIKYFSDFGVNIVMATTGFSDQEQEELFSIVKKSRSGLIYAPNITCGVSTMMLLAELSSKILNNYDIEIAEMHHKNKRDSPSGTAKKLANMLESTKDSETNIPIASVRAGGIVGYHKVMFVGENDMIEITHQSFSRDAFAEGALLAAQFIYGKKGLYEMKDVMKSNLVIEDLFRSDSEQEDMEPAQAISV